MLAIARGRGIYEQLGQADLATTVRPCGVYVLIGYHPHFLMTAGVPTHFDRRTGEPVAIETYVHLLSDHVAAARTVGLSLIEMEERVVDDRWIALKPRWEQYRNHPVSFAMVWRKG